MLCYCPSTLYFRRISVTKISRKEDAFVIYFAGIDVIPHKKQSISLNFTNEHFFRQSGEDTKQFFFNR